MTGKSKTPKPTITTTAAKAIIATIVSVAGLTWSYHLLAGGLVNQFSFITLAAGFILTGLCILFSDRIKILNLRQLSIELERVTEAREEVEARARDVRQVAFSLAEITLFVATLKDRIRRDEHEPDVQTAWLESKVHELLRAISASPEEQTKTFRLFAAAREMDRLRGTIDDKELEERWDEIRRQIANETNPMG